MARRWVKWRQRSSAGASDWEYASVHDDNLAGAYNGDLVEMLTDIGIVPDMSWSDHHRGTDAEFVDLADVPLKTVELALNAANYRLESAKVHRNFLKRELRYRIKTELEKSS